MKKTSKKRSPKAKDTEIVVVLDRSGSMSTIRADMQGGFDSFIEEQRKLPGGCNVTLCQFDNEYNLVYEGLALAQVPKLELVPRGYTALLDAIGRTIGLTEERIKKMKKPPQVLFVVITDGGENSSREFDRARVMGLIERCRSELNWQFVFMGSDEGGIKDAVSLGFDPGMTYAFNNNSVGAAGVAKAITRGTHTYRSMGSFDTSREVSINEGCLEVGLRSEIEGVQTVASATPSTPDQS